MCVVIVRILNLVIKEVGKKMINLNNMLPFYKYIYVLFFMW